MLFDQYVFKQKVLLRSHIIFLSNNDLNQRLSSIFSTNRNKKITKATKKKESLIIMKKFPYIP